MGVVRKYDSKGNKHVYELSTRKEMKQIIYKVLPFAGLYMCTFNRRTTHDAHTKRIITHELLRHP